MVNKPPSCQACPLYECPHIPPFLPDGELKGLIIGEAPAAEEERKGQPFVGAAGRELDEALRGAGLERPQFAIGNVVLCRPPEDRKPRAREIKACRELRDRLIAAVRERNPEAVMVLCGSYALKAYLPEFTKITRVHGQGFEREGRRYFVTYHPAAKLHNPAITLDFRRDFEALARYLEGPVSPCSAQESCGSYKAVSATAPALEELYNSLQTAPLVVLDTETAANAECGPQGALDSLHCDMCGLSLSWETGNAVYIPTPDNTARGQVGDFVARLWRENPGTLFIFHNAVFDLAVLHRYTGGVLPARIGDTIVMAHLLNEPFLGLKELARSRLGMELLTLKELYKTEDVTLVPEAELATYACKDADATLRYWQHGSGLMRPRLWKLFWELEMPITRILLDMKETGVNFNAARVQEIHDKLSVEQEAWYNAVQLLADKPGFNPNSFPQLSSLLYDELGLTPQKSTDAASLGKIRDEHPVVGAILEYRPLQKMVSTYVDNLPNFIDKKTARIHPTFNQTGTAQSRFSCVTLDTEIFTDQGWQKHDALQPGQAVLGYDMASQCLAWGTLQAVHYSREEVWKLTWERGLGAHSDAIITQEARCTRDHRWAVLWDGGPDSLPSFKTASELQDTTVLLLGDPGLGELTGDRRQLSRVGRYPELSRESYMETVWCPTTSLGTWVMRHKGQAVITGNCEAPNLQNQPKRNPAQRIIRTAFGPSPGNYFLSADWSQLELLVMAECSQDKFLVEAFRSRKDLHTLRSSFMFGVPEDRVTADQRRLGKILNFSIQYGASEKNIMEQLSGALSPADVQNVAGALRFKLDPNLPFPEQLRVLARVLLNFIRSQNPGVIEFGERVRYHVAKHGWWETPLGRRRYFPQMMAQERWAREQGFRDAMSMAIQGYAGDIVKMAMVEIYRQLQKTGMRSKMVLQIHDEIIFDTPPEEIIPLLEILEAVIPRTPPLSMPLGYETKVQEVWS